MDKMSSKQEQQKLNPFLYTGQAKRHFPPGMTRVTIQPSIKKIRKGAFSHTRRLLRVDLCDDGLLTEIGQEAFGLCDIHTKDSYSLHCHNHRDEGVPSMFATMRGEASLGRSVGEH